MEQYEKRTSSEEMDRITLELAYEERILRECEFYKPFRNLMRE